MRILFISSFEEDKEEGGVGTYLSDVRQKLESKGHTVKVLSLGEFPHYSDFLPLAYLQKFHSPSNSKKLADKITEFNPDVVHCHQITLWEVPVLKALEKTDAKKVKTFHVFGDLCECKSGIHESELCKGKIESCYFADELSLKQYLFRKPLRFYRNYLRRKIYDKALAPSEDLAELADQFMETEKFSNFVDIEKFEYSEEIGEGVLYFGRVLEKKGVGLLLEAISGLNEDRKLTVIGKGDIEEFEAKVERLGIRDKVDFKGFVPDKELIGEIQSSEVVVVPSLWREAFGLVGIEAMACGTPVIGSNSGGIPDYIDEGENGFVFQRGDSSDLEVNLSSFLKLDDSEKTQLGENARGTAENYSLYSHVDSLINIYDNLVQ